MEDQRERSIVQDAMLISKVIAGELRSWIPEEGVEDFNFLWSQLWDLNWWYTLNKDTNYIYLDRDDGYHVTVQKCKLWRMEKTYYMVYVEKDITDEVWRKKMNLVQSTQWVCHKFRWVRSLKHALYLGQLASENFLGLAYPEQFFLTRDEYDEAFKS